MVTEKKQIKKVLKLLTEDILDKKTNVALTHKRSVDFEADKNVKDVYVVFTNCDKSTIDDIKEFIASKMEK